MKQFYMKHFTPGKEVWYHGRPFIVDYVSIRGYEMWVHFKDQPNAVNSDLVDTEPTLFRTDRAPLV